MVAKTPSKPLSNSPAGTKFAKSMNTTPFMKPKKGSHMGKMDSPIAKRCK